jgi:hypothetical protein
LYRAASVEASRNIQANSSLLSDVKRIHIRYWVATLDELAIAEGCKLDLHLVPFLHTDEEPGCSVFTEIKKLTILHLVVKLEESIVELARWQHARGMAFERVVVRSSSVPSTMAERLTEWVGEAGCCKDEGY